jgi:23S rRNA pseudouridine2605 synthase
VASRRGSDRLIQTGRIQVNGNQVDTPGVLIDPGSDLVLYDGQEVQLPDESTYVLLNKPSGYLVSARDPHHTQTVFDLLEGISVRLFPVGRLDLDTTGVLLLTDDGDLSYRLTHPRYGIGKVYRATVRGVPSDDVLAALREGVDIDEGRTAPAEVRFLKKEGRNGLLELVLSEGRKRQVKQMCAAVGHRVVTLDRTKFAGLEKGKLNRGGWRHLCSDEVVQLQDQVGLIPKRSD